MLFDHASGKARKIWKGDVRHVGIAAGPDGRLRVMWVGAGNAIYAARSNRSATKFGGVVGVKPPGGTDTVWKIAGEGSRGWLDLFVSVSTPGSLAYWHMQVLPGLTIACAGGVGCAVTDAGDPVAGAKVKIGSKAVTTNAKGKASARVAPGTYTAVASKAGYTSGSTRLHA